MLAYPSLAYLHCVLAYPSLAYLHLHTLHLDAFALPLTLWWKCLCVSVSVEVSVYVVQMWWKCQCVSVSVEVSVFKIQDIHIYNLQSLYFEPSYKLRSYALLATCKHRWIYFSTRLKLLHFYGRQTPNYIQQCLQIKDTLKNAHFLGVKQ